MTLDYRAAFLTMAVFFGVVGVAPGQDAEKEKTKPKDQGSEKSAPTEGPAKKGKPRTELATFGGGCFWCQEAVFERLPGVKSVVSGYSGGTVPNPTYQMVCTGLTGHAEVIQIEFDPDVVSYDKLLSIFWSSHDPTTLNEQGPDHGTQYRSIILYHNEAQKKAAIESAKDLKARKVYRRPIVTNLVEFEKFYPAEEYHQDYYRNHRYDDYSQTYIAPKIRKLNHKLAGKAK
jgi:peptide-methionine (S)-S-oxide reductase